VFKARLETAKVAAEKSTLDIVLIYILRKVVNIFLRIPN
jgi:hypothetical protein